MRAHPLWPLLLIVAAFLASEGAAAPTAPTGVAVEAQPPSSFVVTWQDASGETGYRVERKKGCCRPWVPVVDLPAEVVSFVDASGIGPCENPLVDDDLCCNGVEGGGDLLFAYRVWAFDGEGGETQSSNEASNPLPCETPPLCDGEGGDSDGDGVCDDADRCPAHDDGLDADGDGIPDDCEGGPGALIAPTAAGVFSGGSIEDDFLLLLLRLHEPAVGAEEQAAHATQLREVGGEALQVPPWYKVSDLCTEAELRDAVLNDLFPNPSYDRYLVNGDELSELAVAEAMGIAEDRMLAIYRTAQAMIAGSDHEGLPCWLARICVPPETCTTPPWEGEAFRCVYGDSASDITARLGLAHFLAASNPAFSASSRAAFRAAARSLADAHLAREYFMFPTGACPIGSVTGTEICGWIGGGANTVATFEELVMWIGYFPDVVRFLVAAAADAGPGARQDAFLSRAEDVVEQFLMATETSEASLGVGHFNFRWDLAGNEESCASHFLPLPAPCNRAFDSGANPQDDGVVDAYWQGNAAWDIADAPRALWIGDALRAVSLARGSLPAGAFTALEAWVPRLQNQLDAFAGADETCLVWGHDTTQLPNTCGGGFYENGLGFGLYTYLDTEEAAPRLFEALDHFETATGTWDAQPCLGLHRGIRTIKALGAALGRDVETYRGGLLFLDGFESGDTSAWSP